MKMKILELPDEEIIEMLERIVDRVTPEDYDRIKSMADSLRMLRDVLADKNLAIRNLWKVFHIETEKASRIFPDTEEISQQETHDDVSSAGNGMDDSGTTRKGHGRMGAESYRGGSVIYLYNDNLKAGSECPQCKAGHLHDTRTPGVEVRVTGMAPISATTYKLEKLRCSSCSAIYTAKLPKEAGARKYDDRAGAIIVLLKYGTGVPFNRLEMLQTSLEIPLPKTTQWDIVEEVANDLNPVYQQMRKLAAQGEVIHHDDTGAKILSLLREDEEKANAPSEADGEDEKKASRSGIFTTGIVSQVEGHRITLYRTGRNHSGENMVDLLKGRDASLGLPIQMCDAELKNMPKTLQTMLSNCIAHGRRKFVEIAHIFPNQCQYVIEKLKHIYHYDEIAKEDGMSPEERLSYHQKMSEPHMAELKRWLSAQFEEKKVEPNSRLGQAISYMINHWEPLTLFLRVPGAPLDNNICEQALKMAILNRKNAYFYRSQFGAFVGDMMMSIIQTCKGAKANPFDYLTAIQKHRKAVKVNPSSWLPWNYQQARWNVEAEGRRKK